MKTITTTREYDEKGNLVREVRVEYEYPDGRSAHEDNFQWPGWRQPGWWQNPVISWSTTSSVDPKVFYRNLRDAEFLHG